MKKIKDIKIYFIPIEDSRTDKLLQIVYGRIFQKAKESLLKKQKKI